MRAVFFYVVLKHLSLFLVNYTILIIFLSFDCWSSDCCLRDLISRKVIKVLLEKGFKFGGQIIICKYMVIHFVICCDWEFYPVPDSTWEKIPVTKWITMSLHTIIWPPNFNPFSNKTLITFLDIRPLRQQSEDQKSKLKKIIKTV